MRSRLPVGRFSVLLAAALLAGCDAGHRDEPGRDNLMNGPETQFLQPRPGQVLADGRFEMVLDARGLAADGTDRVFASVDGFPPFEVEDTSRPQPIEVGTGSHVLRAWVVDAQGRGYHNPEALAARLFHVGAATSQFHAIGADGFARPFDEDRTPMIHAVVPEGPFSGARGPVVLDVLTRHCRLGPDACALRITVAGRTAIHTEETPLSLDLPAGEHALEVELVRAVPAPDGGGEGEWVRVTSAFASVKQTLVVK